MNLVLYVSLAMLSGALLLERRPRRSPRIAAARVSGLWLLSVFAFLGARRLTTSILLAAAVTWALPATVWAIATLRSKWLSFRATMHAVANTATLLVVLPSAAFAVFGGSWRVLFDQPNWRISLWLHLIAIPAILGLTAIQEFCLRGGGTPDPWDGPRRLVRSGIYSYIANPMEVAAVLVIAAIGIVVHSLPVIVIALLVAAYFFLGSDRAEERRLASAFGSDWKNYAREVKPWSFRWRPSLPGTTATLYVAQSCGLCSEVGSWFGPRKPAGLRLAAAEEHPTRALTRLTYDPGDGSREESGVAALVRALEHINLAWASVGFVMRLPLLRPLIQALVDASGGEARPVPRCALGTGRPGVRAARIFFAADERR